MIDATHDALLRAVLDAPEDDLAMSALADHYEELGKSRHADLVRVVAGLDWLCVEFDASRREYRLGRPVPPRHYVGHHLASVVRIRRAKKEWLWKANCNGRVQWGSEVSRVLAMRAAMGLLLRCRPDCLCGNLDYVVSQLSSPAEAAP